MSSSLAGALDNIYNDTKPDVDMHSSFDDAPPHVTTERYPKQEEEMGDLFGEDSNVDFVHHSRLVLHPAIVPALAALHALNQTE